MEDRNLESANSFEDFQNTKNIKHIDDVENIVNTQIVESAAFKTDKGFEEATNPKPANKKLTIFNFIFIALVFIGLFIYMISVDGIENIVKTLKNVNYIWVFAGLLCLIIQWFCEAIALHLPIKRMYPDQKFSNSFKVNMIGQLFNNLTPFATGGQPMQAYELNKTGKRVSDSLSAMAIKFVAAQTALVLFTFVVIIFEFKFFSELLQNFVWLAIVGFSMNVIGILSVILAGFNKKAITIIINPIIRFFGKIKIIKHPEDVIEKLSHSIDNFSEQFKIIRSEKGMLLKIFIASTFQHLAYFSITYMVYRAFGNVGVSFWQIVPVQSFLLLIMAVIPTPGSGLGAEGGFLLLFNSIFQEGTIHMAILFWRFYTFYLPIIAGALFMIPKKK